MENCSSSHLKWKALIGGNSVAKYEKKQLALKQAAEKLNSAETSDKVKEYLELQAYITSDEFKRKKEEIDSLRYNGSEIHQKEQEYKKKAADKRIKNYHKMKGSQELAFYEQHKDSDKLARYLELKTYFESDEFAKDKQKIEQTRQEELENLKTKKQRYNTLSKKLKWFIKLEKSEKFQDFLHFKDDDTFKQYLKLNEEVKNYSLKQLKKRLIAEQKKYQKQKKDLEQRVKELTRLSQKENEKEGSGHKEELERLKKDLASGQIDQKIKDVQLEQSDEYIKIKEHEKLLKNKRIKGASKYYFSEEFKSYEQAKDSAEVQELRDLEEYMQNDYQAELKKAKSNTFKNADLNKKFQGYKGMKKDSDIRRILKIEKKEKLKHYNELNGSDEIKEFEQIKAFINSDEFKKEKAYLKNSKRFKQTEEYAKVQRKKALEKSEEVKFYLKNKTNAAIMEYRSWEPTFTETFEKSDALSRWSATPYPVSEFFEGTFSQWNEEQCFTAKNHQASNGILRIETKQEDASGTAWHPTMGFIPKKFTYTTANLNTGDAFRQKFGKFEVKAKFSHAQPITHVLALSSGKRVPQINLVNYGNYGKKSYQAALYSMVKGAPKRAECKVNHVDLSKGFNIFTLLWNENKVEWHINGESVASQTSDIPHEELFWNLFSMVPEDPSQKASGAVMQVDWIKAYRKKITSEE